MKKGLKITLIAVCVLVGIIVLDTLQARIFKNSPIISWKEKLEGNSYVDKGILMDTYYCVREQDIVTTSWHFKNNKFTCPIYNESKDDENNSFDNREECCKGCLCGDTIELLKTTETAWLLTKINNKGEYDHIKGAFINFHGTEKNKFAFFKNDEEINGEFTINEKNEIILLPDDDKNNKITCRLGEEKDLIAVMHCDNNFGIFTLQKQGTLELPSIIKDTISKTKIIKVKGHQSITKAKEINVLLSVINNSKVWTGAVTLPGPKYELELFDVNNNSIAKILYNPGHYFSIKINGKSYELTNIDKNSLNTILEK